MSFKNQLRIIVALVFGLCAASIATKSSSTHTDAVLLGLGLLSWGGVALWNWVYDHYHMAKGDDYSFYIAIVLSIINSVTTVVLTIITAATNKPVFCLSLGALIIFIAVLGNIVRILPRRR